MLNLQRVQCNHAASRYRADLHRGQNQTHRPHNGGCPVTK
uniref:Uncharacterized protein n=1 Tax=Anguilla anguilla TaxID=7936 RepID=A0A0E9UH19_ANGAN